MAKITVYQDRKKKWRWNIKSTNGNLIAESGEAYERVDGCLNGLKATAKALGVERADYYRHGEIVTTDKGKKVWKQKKVWK